jgi:hypothetical protein
MKHKKIQQILVSGLILASLFSTATSALACWTTMLQECFERTENQWPWITPTGGSRRWTVCVQVGSTLFCNPPSIPPQYLRWGPQDDFFNNAICPPEHDTQSCWVIGQPRTQDPEFDDYPPNLDTYMTYGPLNLAGQTAARVTFYLLNQSETQHDSVYWGAVVGQDLTSTTMQVGGSFSGRPEPQEYQVVQFDLSNLRNYTTHDSVSLLDSSDVYVFWRFKADNNANSSDYGSFVDEVVIRFDDGCLDLIANEALLHHPDGRLLTRDPEFGDSLYASIDLSTCDGAVDEIYPAFRVMGTVGANVVLDQLIQGADRNQRFVLNSNIWVVDGYGDFTARFSVDTLNTAPECNENNNIANAPYHVEPPNPAPQFMWLAPGADTLFISTTEYLRWTCTDPGETASINLAYDVDTVGCEGIPVPGGSFIAENDGPDSLLWDLASAPEGRVYHVYATVSDAANNICVYAAHPVVKRTLATGETPLAIPREMYLAQNYPNPFNPATEIRYGIARGGFVTLKVYNLLGREVATLVNNELSPGHYQANFAGNEWGSGLYFYTLSTPEGIRTHKMLLLR